MSHLNGNNGDIMKIGLAESYIDEHEYLKNFSKYSQIDEQILNFEKNIEEHKHTLLVHIFREEKDSKFSQFLIEKLKTSEEYSRLVEKKGVKRLYLSMQDADDVIQLTDIVDKIENDEDWQKCIDTIKRTPNFISYWMKLSNNPYVLCVLFDDMEG